MANWNYNAVTTVDIFCLERMAQMRNELLGFKYIRAPIYVSFGERECKSDPVCKLRFLRTKVSWQCNLWVKHCHEYHYCVRFTLSRTQFTNLSLTTPAFPLFYDIKFSCVSRLNLKSRKWLSFATIILGCYYLKWNIHYAITGSHSPYK